MIKPVIADPPTVIMLKPSWKTCDPALLQKSVVGKTQVPVPPSIPIVVVVVFGLIVKVPPAL